MTGSLSHRRLTYLVLAGRACRSPERRATAQSSTASYVYVFAGDADHSPGESDFLAVIGADTTSATYAQVRATIPIGAGGTMPHHTEMEMPAGGRSLFANAFMTGRTYPLELAHPLAPRVPGMLHRLPAFRL